jgi:hypothetical protein
MKLIKFNTNQTAEAEALQLKIHNHLLTKHNVNGFKYVADKWVDTTSLPYNATEDKIGVLIEKTQPLYGYITECLTQAEIDLIEEVSLDWHTSNL